MVKKIKGYLFHYITSNGKVYSTYKRTKKYLLLTVNNDGYLKVTIGRNTFLVHELVAREFVPNPDNKPYVQHKDFNPRNNIFSNLEWVDEIKLAPVASEVKRNLSGREVQVKQYNKSGKLIAYFKSIREASRQTGINCTSIGQCRRGERGSAGGYIWR